MTIFISYQRADTLFAAHALGYATKHAGYDSFVDTGKISGGALFRQIIAEEIAKTKVMLALIGENFNFTRLHEPANVVAYEWHRAQFHRIPVVPVLVAGGNIPSDSAFPAELRWFTRRNAYQLRRSSLSTDIDLLVDAIPDLSSIPRRAIRVLWVDDRPANNEKERKALREHGLVFDNVVSTSEALGQLANESYDLIITDFGRARSSDRSQTAGADFLTHPLLAEGSAPIVVYSNEWVVRKKEELLQLGASEVTSNPLQLILSVLGLLGRTTEGESFSI